MDKGWGGAKLEERAISEEEEEEEADEHESDVE